MKLSNKTYDILKKVALILAPLITFIGALCAIWGVPHSEQITATLAALDTLIGSLLTISSYQHNKPYEMDITGLTYIDDEEGADVDE